MYSMWYVTIPLLGVSEDVSLSFNTYVSLTFTLPCHTQLVFLVDVLMGERERERESSARLKICLRHWANVDPRVLCLIGNQVEFGGACSSTRNIPQIS